jgi:membrane-anchored protein YejM (alkaline phosphatase superfamily)
MQRDFPRQAALCPNWQFNFYSLSVLHCLWLTRGFLALALPAAAADLSTLFHVTAWLCYGLLYLAPVPLLGRAAERRLPARSALPPLLVLATSAATLIALQADLLLYQLYEFHLNGFVWNLLTTPGVLASLGSSASTYRSVAVLISTSPPTPQ